MNSIISLLRDNVGLLGFLISLVTFGFTAYKFYLQQPKLEFYSSYMRHFYIHSTAHHLNSTESPCTAFVYLQIANPTSIPCTIYEFIVRAENFEDAFHRCKFNIRDEYSVPYADAQKGNITLRSKDFVRVPLVIPPFGYAEGYVVFPETPMYNRNELNVEIIARTPKKDFSYFDVIHYCYDDK